jgi:hypothetical protein
MKTVATYDERKASALFQRFARNGTWMCPTVIVIGAVLADRTRDRDSRMQYIPTSVEESWRNALNQRLRVALNADERKMWRERMLEVVGLMHRTGVRLLAGTDGPYPYVFPGFSLHEELELFVQSGLSPARSSANGNP